MVYKCYAYYIKNINIKKQSKNIKKNINLFLNYIDFFFFLFIGDKGLNVAIFARQLVQLRYINMTEAIILLMQASCNCQ